MVQLGIPKNLIRLAGITLVASTSEIVYNGLRLYDLEKKKTISITLFNLVLEMVVTNNRLKIKKTIFNIIFRFCKDQKNPKRIVSKIDKVICFGNKLEKYMIMRKEICSGNILEQY